MGKINQIINQIATSCEEEKGQYEWLDDILDKIVENAKTILPLLPDEDIFEHSKVNFICEDHHDGFIHEVWITLEDNEEGLCIAIDDLGFSILNGSADVFGSWDYKEEKPYRQIAKEMYEFAKNNLNGKTTICYKPFKANDYLHWHSGEWKDFVFQAGAISSRIFSCQLGYVEDKK